MLLCFTGFYWVLMNVVHISGFYLGYTGLGRILLGFTEFHWVLQGFTGFY